MSNPKISVIMSAYNESINEFKGSIDSILNQTFEDLELICIGDNPDNDNIRIVVEGIADSRFQFIPNDQNMGLVYSLNKAISYAKGEYIARMDADDIALPVRLERQLSFLKDNDLDMIGSDIAIIDEEGNVVREKMHFPLGESKIKRCLPFGGCMPHPTWFVKRDVYERISGYRNIPGCEDYDFLTRVVADGSIRIGNVPEALLQYRVRDNSISQSAADKQYLTRWYISKNRKSITDISEVDIHEYIGSDTFTRELVKYQNCQRDKKAAKENKDIVALERVLFNKYLYYYVLERLFLKYREWE